MNQEAQSKKMHQVIDRCWSDESFKQQLLANPAGTLNAEGVTVPEGVAVKAVENTDKVWHLVVPAKPTDLSDDDLDRVAGGTACDPGFCAGCNL